MSVTETNPPTRPADPGQPRPVGELIADVTRDMSLLARQEVRLAKTELQDKVNDAGRAIGLIVLGGAMLSAALLVLLQAIVSGLATEMPRWLAGAIVGGVVLLLALIILGVARSKLSKSNLEPDTTLNQLDKDRAMVKEHVK